MGITCWTPGCNHNNMRETCRFFRFPKDKKARRRWLTLLGRDGEPTSGSRVCSCHFRDGVKDNGPEIFAHNIGKIFLPHHFTPENEKKIVKHGQIIKEEHEEENAELNVNDPLEISVETPHIGLELPPQAGPSTSSRSIVMLEGLLTSKFCVYRPNSAIDTLKCDSKTPEVFECQFCEFETNLKVELTEHHRIFHQGKEGNEELENILKCYSCKNCDFETHSVLVLTAHDNSCNANELETMHNANEARIVENDNWNELVPPTGVKFYKCKHCHYQTSYKSCIMRHIKQKKHFQDKNRFKCGQCWYQPKTETQLKSHIQRHLKSKVIKWLQCEQCPFRSKTKCNLKAHIMRRHMSPGDIKWFQCDQCIFQGKTRYELESHTKRHMKAEDINWFKCEQCAFQAKRKNELKLHNIRIHMDPEEIQWLQCGQCTYKTKDRSSLRRHITRIHTKLENANCFQCGHCTYQAKRKDILKQHIATKHLKL